MTAQSGYVYIFLRADGLRKLGWTTRLERRQREHLKVTGIIHEYEMAWQMGTRGAYRVEQIAHRSLKGLSCAGSREVYNLPLRRLIVAVEYAMERVSFTMPDGIHSMMPARPKRDAVIFAPPNWSEIIPAANAQFQADPTLCQAMMAHFAEVGATL